MDDWKEVTPEHPEQGVPVETKIDGIGGPRNETTLVRQGRLWFTPDFVMYVYYTPTHWRETS
jgi:hypothetical protein